MYKQCKVDRQTKYEASLGHNSKDQMLQQGSDSDSGRRFSIPGVQRDMDFASGCDSHRVVAREGFWSCFHFYIFSDLDCMS